MKIKQRLLINLIRSIALSILMMYTFTSFAQKNLDVKQIKLDNGLTVFLNEDHTSSNVFGLVITKVGGKNDSKDATGMAHYMEHMLFKGTTELATTNWEKEKPHIDKIFSLYDELGKTKDDDARLEIQKQINDESIAAGKYSILNEMSSVINRMGGTNMNAGTGPDYTLFYNAFPPSQIERWLELYSHRFINPVFRTFQSELEVVYEEKNMYSDMFFSNILKAFNKNFFKNHPYGQQPLIGTMEHLKNPSLTKMYAFFKKWYVPNNMALIISGDFNTDEVIPLIKEKFGVWKPKVLPERKVWEEKPFKGREFVKVKMSPVKLGLFGFRTPVEGHPDKVVMEVCNGILANENQTGLLDKLVLDNKVMAAQAMLMPYSDYGASIIFVVPKIIGQKLENAEDLVFQQLDKLKKGEFDDDMVEAIKKQLYKRHLMSLESSQDKALMIASAFGSGVSIDETLNYHKKIMKITKEDVIRIANKYYGDNYLAFYSKMGFPKKDKIDKPGFKPVISNTNAESVFAKHIRKIPAKKAKLKFVDFNNDVKKVQIQDGVEMFYTENPVNDIFTLEIKFEIGEGKMPLLGHAANMMNYAATKTKSLSQLKMEFSKIGCSYFINSDNSYVTISLNGLDSQFNESLKLINDLINNPVLDESKLAKLLEEVKTDRKMEDSEPSGIADALVEYILYGDKSSYLDRLSMKEIKKLTTEQLISEFKTATKYQVQIHYAGAIALNTVTKNFKDNLIFFKKLKKGDVPYVRKKANVNENVVYFVNKKNASQSQIILFANGKPFTKEEQAKIDAFNMYFGGGFSGLVLQEVREYRSMAYSAGANVITPVKAGLNSNFSGFVGTQADKTIDALDIYYGLLRDMPEKPERMQMINDYLSESITSKRPGFRNMSKKVLNWENLGYTEDPAKSKLEAYKKLSFEDILKFYRDNIKNEKIAIAIVGDKKRIDTKKLTKFGKVIKVKQKKLFK